MSRHYPAHEDYADCTAEITPAGNAGEIYNLKLTYKAKTKTGDFKELKKAILKAKATSSVKGIVTYFDDLLPEDGYKRLKVTFTKNTQGQDKFTSNEMRTLTYNLDSTGAADKAAEFVRAFCDGSGVASMVPPPAPAPTTATATTPAAAPAMTPVASAAMLYLGNAATAPATTTRYQTVSPLIHNNTMTLRFTLNGPAGNPNVAADYIALRTDIEAAIKKMPPRPDGSTIDAIPGHPQSHVNPNGGVYNAFFDVEFKKINGISPRMMYADDMEEVAVALKNANCLTPQDRLTIYNTITAAKFQPGWVQAPLAPPPASQISGATAVSKGMTPPAPSTSPTGSYQAYDSCDIVTNLSTSTVLTLKYTIKGVVSSLRADHLAMKHDIEQAIASIPAQNGARLEAYVSSCTSQGNASSGIQTGEFNATFRKWVGGQLVAFTVSDIETITKKINAIGLLTASDKGKIDAQAPALVGGWGRGIAAGTGSGGTSAGGASSGGGSTP